MLNTTRRDFLKHATTGAMAAWAGGRWPAWCPAQERGERPKGPDGVTVLNPRGRVPVSLIIDDSTCLVNLAHFCIPQFAEVFPDRYKQNWRALPREIPDDFVRKFGEWCHEHGVKGKYSIVPYPACVGWVDREMPGWSKKQLDESLNLVRTVIMPDWDIHPEMVTHTWAIDTKTGRPYPERTEKYMENWGFSIGKSVDELADYIAYALRVLKNAGLPCEGVTTPGGFGNRVLQDFSYATLQAVRDVFKAEIPHYFRHLFTGDESVAPRVEYAAGIEGDNPRCVVSIIGCTGDWFGGWDGLERGSVERFITEDLKGGRLVEVIDRGEPAIMVSHWPGIYFNGDEVGFNIFKEIVGRLKARYDNLVWMKNSEIARYWAARELTRITHEAKSIALKAPFACPGFTLQFSSEAKEPPRLESAGQTTMLSEVRRPLDLKPGTFVRDGQKTTVCFDLPKGESRLLLG
jgi:hypothetical protein